MSSFRHPAFTPPGFSLVVTVTVLALVGMLAMGFLTLSSVLVRSSHGPAAKAQAEANARLALMLAISQLQEAAGPDQRITVPATVTNPESTPALTGVWESFRLDPEGSPGLEEAKGSVRDDEEANGEFVGWMTSGTFGKGPVLAAPDTTPGPGHATLLRVPGTTDSESEVAAALRDVGRRGGMAWLTIDEGVKARFQLPELGPQTGEEKMARLRAPARNMAGVLPEFAGYLPTASDAAKVVSHAQGALAATDRNAYASRFHDLTPWSAGLATNVVEGGLKGDLTLAFEPAELPAALRNRHVYSNRRGIPLTPSDPLFSTLADHYRLYQRAAGPDRPMALSLPPSYKPAVRNESSSTAVPRLDPPNGSVITPVVTRVNVVFSLVGHEGHGNWHRAIPRRTGDPDRKYMVYMIYTPVVTLYNPYTVPIKVDHLKVSFAYLPLAFQFFRSGHAQSVKPGLLSQLHLSSDRRTDWEDRFTVTLSGDPKSSTAQPVTLQPGEARIFGVNHPPGALWDDMTNFLWQNDLDRSKTLDLITREGWDYNSGIIVDWLAPRGAEPTEDNHGIHILGVRGDDTIDVAITPAPVTYSDGRQVDHFEVEVSALVDRQPRPLAHYRYRYGSIDRLVEAMEGGTHPAHGEVSYPMRREKPFHYNEIYQENAKSTPVEQWTGPKQFAIFTLADRTSKDSLYPTKSGLHTSFVHPVLDMDITETHPAHMPMELSFLPVTGAGVNTAGSLEVMGANDPRSFFFSGWRVYSGFTNYPTYEIPRAPLVNIADLRHANLASSGHLPIPAYTVGESRPHPLLPADRAIAPAPGGSEYADHAWLANNTLWDRYYFSGMRGGFHIGEFLDGGTLPLVPRARAHLPSGESAQSAIETLKGEDGWRSAAAFQLHHGAFNVHSTSVEAWRMVLSALRQAKVPRTDPVTLEAHDDPGRSSVFPRLLGGPSSRMDDGQSADNQVRWAGFRDLTDAEIERLAEEIVAGVRTHGPFLSMAEFVNRRLDGDPASGAVAGILQEAIARAGLNDRSGPLYSRLVTNEAAAEFGYANPAAAIGNTEEGSAAFLSQGDLLSAIGASLTVRSDTFLIRAYGETRGPGGEVLASAICEAVVQRLPEFVDPANPVEATPHGEESVQASPLGRRFGRQFRIVSFRWVRAEEV